MRLSLNNISVSFGENEVLKNIDFVVNDKDKIALIGRNGCGKTTLLNIISGLITPDCGKLELEPVSYLFQPFFFLKEKGLNMIEFLAR